MIDLTGQRFGRLTVLEKTNLRRNGGILWRCVCDCGQEKLVKATHLTNGNIASCGCLRRDVLIRARQKQLWEPVKGCL